MDSPDPLYIPKKNTFNEAPGRNEFPPRTPRINDQRTAAIEMLIGRLFFDVRDAQRKVGNGRSAAGSGFVSRTLKARGGQTVLA